MKKLFTLLMVVLISTSVLPVLVQSVVAESSGLIQIAADGSVLGTSLIQRDGNVYTVTGNISGGIQIQKSHIVLDGAGYAVEGNGEGRGVDLSNGRGQDPSRPEVSNVTVKNLKILNFYYGVDNVNTHGNTFIGNYIENCENSFWMGGYDSLITYNTLKNASIAINFAGSNNITLNNFVWLSSQQIVDGNYWSDYMARYPDAKEIDNTGVWDTPYAYWENTVDHHPFTKPIAISLYDNSEGTHTIYIRADGSIEGTDKIQRDGNTYAFSGDVYGSVVVEKDDLEINGSGFILHGIDGEGGIVLENRNNVILRNIEIVDATFGITIRNGSKNEITESNCRINLEDSFNNTIYGNERISMLFTNSSNNTVTGNRITDSTLYGFKLQSASNENIIFGNKITDSVSGVEFHGNSSYNTVYENWIVDNADGMIFFTSFNNTIYDNVIANNSNSGIFLRSSSRNKFFRNDIVANSQQVICWYGTNIWDNGQVGNYWSNYNGTDSDGDGIGDEPHLLLCFSIVTGESYEADNYPLMKPVTISETEPFPIVLVIAALVVIVVVVAGLLVYLKKHGRGGT